MSLWGSRKDRKRISGANTDANPPGRAGIDLAWRAHDAIQGWTSSVDAKASIVVVAETLLAGAAIRALVTKHGGLHSATGLHLACGITAASLLIFAVASALWVVFPRLERSRTKRLATQGLIYFGHLQDRSPEDIARSLATLTPDQERLQLAQQLQITGKIAWRKHSRLQLSIIALGIGSLLLVLSYTAF